MKRPDIDSIRMNAEMGQESCGSYEYQNEIDLCDYVEHLETQIEAMRPVVDTCWDHYCDEREAVCRRGNDWMTHLCTNRTRQFVSMAEAILKYKEYERIRAANHEHEGR